MKWIPVVILALFLSVGQLHAADEELKAREVASIILWFAEDGIPQDIFILDRTHYTIVSANMIIINRTPYISPHDEILMGGMFNIQNRGYFKVFAYPSNRLNTYYQSFVQDFKGMAKERIKHLRVRPGREQ